MAETDEFGVHEVYHMSSFLMQCVGRELLTHEAIMNNKQWTVLAEKAHSALFDLYQSIGLAHVIDAAPPDDKDP